LGGAKCYWSGRLCLMTTGACSGPSSRGAGIGFSGLFENISWATRGCGGRWHRGAYPWASDSIRAWTLGDGKRANQLETTRGKASFSVQSVSRAGLIIMDLRAVRPLLLAGRRPLACAPLSAALQRKPYISTGAIKMMALFPATQMDQRGAPKLVGLR